MNSFYDYHRKHFENAIANTFGREKAKFRAEIVFRQIYKKSITEFLFVSTLQRQVIEWLNRHYSFDSPVSLHSIQSSEFDCSTKFIIQLNSDKQLIETVLIPERGRLTLCISTQVGCAQACRFCQTGRMGIIRNLTTSEIIGQILLAQKWQNEKAKIEESANQNVITNVVFMGMGEPLDNIDNVINSVNIICDTQGLNLSPNKVTVSSVGVISSFGRLFKETKVAFALSLHSPFEDQRSKLMPVNIKFPITEVISQLEYYVNNGYRKQFMIQYMLIRGVNDSSEHAHALVSLLKNLPVKINLIPLNEHEGTAYRRPDLGQVYAFQQQLKTLGKVTTIRLSKGRDIQAACGQLLK